MPDAVLLRTERLTRAYGSLLAVSDVDVSVQRGELRSIIGPNGAGKTTFFRLISGEMPPTSGRIFFGEREITGLPQHAVARLGVAKSYQITNVFPHLTVHENVRVAVQGHARAFNFWSRADRLTDDKSGEGYFAVEVALEPDDVKKSRVDLQAGMPAEVIVPTRPRSLFEYLLGPLRDELTRAFREH